MKIAARLFPLFFSGLLLAAHFLRWGNLPLALACLFFPAVVFFRKAWARVAAWFYCGFGVVVWVLVTNRFVSERMLVGRPWGKLVIILGTVALISVIAGALLCGKRMRAWFQIPEDPA